MITCPSCKNTLPDWTTTCQFCNTDVRAVARPKGTDDVPRYGGKLPDKVIWRIYYAVCGFWVLCGGLDLLWALSSKEPAYVSLAFGIF